jgi:hypothetical protein
MRITNHTQLMLSPLQGLAPELYASAKRKMLRILRDKEGVSRYNGDTHFYILRDQLRFVSGDWTALHDFQGEEDVAHRVDPRYALHVSAKDKKLVAYTPYKHELKRYADVPTVTKLGKFLTKYYSGTFTEGQINDIGNAYGNRDLTGQRYKVELLKTPEEIKDLYTNRCTQSGMGSCLSKAMENWGLKTAEKGKLIHPAEAYGHSPEAAIAVLYEKGKVNPIARALCDVKKTTYVRVYGNIPIMERELEKMGMSRGDFTFKIPYIHVTLPDNRRKSSNLMLLPYLDTNAKACATKDGFDISKGNRGTLNGYHGRCTVNVYKCSHCDKIQGAGDNIEFNRNRISNLDPVLEEEGYCDDCIDDNTKFTDAYMYRENAPQRNNPRRYHGGGGGGRPQYIIQHLNTEPLTQRLSTFLLTVRTKKTSIVMLTKGDDWEHDNMTVLKRDLDKIVIKHYKSKKRFPVHMLVKGRINGRANGWMLTDEAQVIGGSNDAVLKEYVEKHPDKFWTYKNVVYKTSDKVKAIISRDKKTAYRPKQLTSQHRDKEEYYDTQFLNKYMRHQNATVVTVTGKEKRRVYNIHPWESDTRWASHAEKTGAKYTHHWADEAA